MSKEAARKCYEKSGLGPGDIDVIELHDCFSSNELLTYEALGLCPEGSVFHEMPINLVNFSGKISSSPLNKRINLLPFLPCFSATLCKVNVSYLETRLFKTCCVG